ncbi:MAG: hypothetical protein WCO00_00165 [Rhodospirillaceae bacterium]
MLAEWLSSQDSGFVDLDNGRKRIDALVTEALVLLERDDNALPVNRRLHEALFLIDHQFSTEQSLMKLSLYPDLIRHTGEHKKFLAEFETILNISGFSCSCLRHVALFVLDFLSRHRDGADQRFEAFLRTTPETVRQDYCRRAIEITVFDDLLGQGDPGLI